MDESSIAGNIVPMIGVVGIARDDAAHLVRDHLEGFAMGGAEEYPSWLLAERFLEALHDASVVAEMTMGGAAFHESAVDVSQW